MSILTNRNAMVAQNNQSSNSRSLNKVMAKISSGLRTHEAAADAAGLAVSENLDAAIGSNGMALRNGNDSLKLMETAEGGLTEVASLLVRMRELAVQASSETLADNERAFASDEFVQSQLEIARIRKVTEHNGIKLLDGSLGDGLQVQVGIHDSASDRIAVTIGDVATTNGEFLNTKSMRFDGTDDFVVLGAMGGGADIGNRSNTSLSIWFKTSDMSAEQAIYGTSNHKLKISSAGGIQMQYSDGGGSQYPGSSSGSVGLNTWHHAVFTYDSSDAAAGGKLYLDGALQGAKAASGGLDASTTAPALASTLGSHSYQAFTGDLDEVSVWDKTLTGDEVSSMYNSGQPTNPENSEGLLSLYRMGDDPSDDSTAGTGTIRDQVGSNHGTPKNTSGSEIVSDIPEGGTDGVSLVDTSTLKISTAAEAQAALSVIDAGLDANNQNRSRIGASMNRVMSAMNNLEVGNENLSSARSKIRDTDFAMATAQMARTQIMDQAAVSVMGQANSMSQMALRLI